MIRRMEHSDLDVVLAIWLQGNIAAHHFVPAAYWEGHLDYMRGALPQADVWVYDVGERAVAFMGFDGDHLAGLFVGEGYRSRGIGHALLAHAKALHDSITLCVYEKNAHALEFYRHEAFLIDSCRVDDATGENEYMMRWNKYDRI